MGNAQLKDDIDDTQVFADELAAGSELMHGQYKIESFLNAGGFGITYSARDSLDRRVVIKECFPGAFCRRSTALVTARSRAHQNELASIVRLFVQEARSLSKLDHPNIVGVHQVFEENNTAYMALDFIEGNDLLMLIEDDKKLEPDAVENILRKVLDAIGFIHDKGILHRDISPDNILMNEEGDPVLIDFGAAREEATKKSRVLSALRVVKDGYSPQEFYIAGSEQGPYSDLYALGATFYHLITGELPPNSQARLSAVASGENDLYLPLKGRIEGHSEKLLASIDMSLAILPKDRITSAQAWIDMIDGKVATAAANTAAIEGFQKPKKVSGKGLLLATVGIMALGLAIASQTELGETQALAPVMNAIGGALSPEVTDGPTEGSAALDGTDLTVEASAAPFVADTQPDIAAPAPEAEAFTVEAPAPVISEPEVDPALQAATASVAEDEAQLAALAFAAEQARIVEEAEAKAALQRVLDDLPQPQVFARDIVGFSAPAFQPQTVDISFDAPVTARVARFEIAPLSAPQADMAAFFDSSVPPVPVPPAASHPDIAQNWRVVLPYSGLFNAEEGETRIFSVNGIEVDTRQAFDQAVRASFDMPENGNLSLTVDMGTSARDLSAQTWSLPVAYQTNLSNGIAFETTEESGKWITRVTEVPANSTSELKPGDVIFGYIPTSELLEQRDDIYNILSRELTSGTERLSFAVHRGDITWVVNFTIEPTKLAEKKQ